STAVGKEALAAALNDAGIDAAALTAIIVSNVHTRVPAAVMKGLDAAIIEKVPSPTGALGFAGASDALLGLVALLEHASPGDRFALVSIADGADACIFEATPAIATWQSAAPMRDQIAARAAVPYGRYLAWRGVLPVQPPNRPEPARMSAPAANRRLEWKYGLVGTQDDATGATHLPPARVSWDGGAVDHMHPISMADAIGTVATFTVDRLAWSPSPPVIFAVVDFQAGGRVPIELTDCAPEDITVGTKVEMTFRRINTADGIANYFWKARPHLVAGAEHASPQKEN
ncbi:MAG: OB-fold domain-containing protein, partial [Acidimicrobiia bacterium]